MQMQLDDISLYPEGKTLMKSYLSATYLQLEATNNSIQQDKKTHIFIG